MTYYYKIKDRKDFEAFIPYMERYFRRKIVIDECDPYDLLQLTNHSLYWCSEIPFAYHDKGLISKEDMLAKLMLICL